MAGADDGETKSGSATVTNLIRQEPKHGYCYLGIS